MKTLLLLPLFLISSQAHATIAQNCTLRDVEQSQRAHDRASQLVGAGLYSRDSLLKLDWALRDIKLCAGLITLEQYCAAMKPALTQYIDDAGSSTGRMDFPELSHVMEKLISVRENCLDNQ